MVAACHQLPQLRHRRAWQDCHESICLIIIYFFLKRKHRNFFLSPSMTEVILSSKGNGASGLLTQF